MTEQDSLKRGTVLVTGTSSGLGEGIARRLGRDGTRVGVGYKSGAEKAEAVVEGIRDAGGKAVAISGDMSKEEDVADAFGQLEAAFGPVTGLVINAGVQADAAFAQMSLDTWRKVMAIDLDGAFLTAREVIRRFDAVARGEGDVVPAIVFVTSVHAWIPWAGHVNYAAAKGGAEMLMRSLAQEVAGCGIRVNAVAPGAIRTPINEPVWSDEKRLTAILDLIPLGRLGESEDVARAVSLAPIAGLVLRDRSHPHRRRGHEPLPGLYRQRMTGTQDFLPSTALPLQLHNSAPLHDPDCKRRCECGKDCAHGDCE